MSEEKSVYRGISSGGTGGSLSKIDTKDGKIVRIRPMRWKENYDDEWAKTRMWEMDARGKTFKCPEKSNPPHNAYAYKKRVYSPNRVMYPLKRVDWEPGGDPEKVNAQNRGKSKFKRISWDEAAQIIKSEVDRIAAKYGPNSIICVGEDGHKESKDIHAGGGWHSNLMDAVNGTFTREVRTPDSTEGWYWGAKHVWGSGCYQGLGMMGNQRNVMKYTFDNTEFMVMQSGDWEAQQNYATQFWSTVINWMKEVDIEFVVIDPFCNYTAVAHDMKWIPIRPNTDAALDFAIMYTWIVEDTYDHEYIESHTVGFEKLKAYIMGEEDGIPKTPAWAATKCDIPEYTIKELARHWAKKVTTIGHYCGCHIRGPYSHEPARTEVYKLAMQGVGKPGIGQVALFSWQFAWPKMIHGEDTYPAILGQRAQQFVPKDQQVPRTMVHHAILEKDIEWWGGPQIVYELPEDQFEKHEYPIPEDEGGARLHMVWSEKPCNSGCWNGGFLWQEAMQDPDLECVITNHQWLENDSLFADLVLPVTTCLEEKDDVGCSQNDMLVTVALCEPASDVVGESKSDYEIAARIAEAWGEDTVDEITQGMTVDEWLDLAFNSSEIVKECSFEEIQEKHYYALEYDPDTYEWPAGYKRFYDDPEENPLDTPTGKIEFYSEAIAENFPDDFERGPVAHWIEGGPASEGWTHDESPWGERAKKYPLTIVANPGRWRIHVQGDDITWFREIETCKVRGKDGYMYEPCWMSPNVAKARGIQNGDIVKVYNDRGTVLCGARVSERMTEGSVMVNKGSRADPITNRLDRGGAINMITPEGPISMHCKGFVVTGFLVEVEKVTDEEMSQWRNDYPDAFARAYDPNVGLVRESWVVEE